MQCKRPFITYVSISSGILDTSPMSALFHYYLLTILANWRLLTRISPCLSPLDFWNIECHSIFFQFQTRKKKSISKLDFLSSSNLIFTACVAVCRKAFLFFFFWSVFFREKTFFYFVEKLFFYGCDNLFWKVRQPFLKSEIGFFLKWEWKRQADVNDDPF